MTRLPTENRDVNGFDGPEYPLNVVCAAPSCLQRPEEGAHHLWRRSELGGAYSWVTLPDGSQVGNLIRLCFDHHRQITENKARIIWGDHGFYWSDRTSDLDGMALSFQPPYLLGEVDPTFENPGEKNGEPWVFDLTRSIGENECPLCHQALPKPKIESKPEKPRVRRTWSITVPADHREDGAETLDVLLEAARQEMAKKGLAYGDEKAVRYFVLATALGLFVTHFHELASDGPG